MTCSKIFSSPLWRATAPFLLATLSGLAACGGGGSSTPQLSSNTRLASLEASAGELAPAFEPMNQSYLVGPGLLSGSSTLTATPEDPGATIEVNAAPVPAGSASAELPLELGMTPATVTVTAPDGSSATYSVVFERYLVGEQERIKASNAGSEDTLGRSVAISGDTLVVGAPSESSSATGGQADDSVPGAGAVYVFTLTDAGWTQQAYLKALHVDVYDSFGFSVAIDGDTLVVGAPFEDGSATGGGADNSTDGAGAAFVFTRMGTSWTEQARLKASNAGAEDQFGRSVAISGDTLVVGAPGESSLAGAAYVFTRMDSSWSEQARVKAFNADAYDFFGASVAISGDTLVVGAEYEEGNDAGGQEDNSLSAAGAAYVFTRTGASWTQQAYLKASIPQPNAGFGSAVTISGDTLVVGVFREASSSVGNEGDDSAAHSGAAYVFRRTGTSWIQEAFLKAYNAETYDHFGKGVSISGDTLLVGADGESSSAAGGQADNSASRAGAAYVFTRTGSSWTQQVYLKSHNGDAEDRFGWAVAVDGDTLAIGAWGESGSANGGEADNSAMNAGAVYICR